MSQTQKLAEGIFEALASKNQQEIDNFKKKVTKQDVKDIIAYLLKHYVTYSEGFIFTFFEQCTNLNYTDWIDILKIVDVNFEKGRTYSMEAFLYISYVWLGINLFTDYAQMGNEINQKERKYFLRLFGYTTGLLYRSDYDKEMTLQDYGRTLNDLKKNANKLVSQGATPATLLENNQVSYSSQENPPKGWEWVKDYPVKKRK